MKSLITLIQENNNNNLNNKQIKIIYCMMDYFNNDYKAKETLLKELDDPDSDIQISKDELNSFLNNFEF